MTMTKLIINSIFMFYKVTYMPDGAGVYQLSHYVHVIFFYKTHMSL